MVTTTSDMHTQIKERVTQLPLMLQTKIKEAINQKKKQNKISSTARWLVSYLQSNTNMEFLASFYEFCQSVFGIWLLLCFILFIPFVVVVSVLELTLYICIVCCTESVDFFGPSSAVGVELRTAPQQRQLEPRTRRESRATRAARSRSRSRARANAGPTQ